MPASPGPAAIETRGLRRIYKVKPVDVVALEQVDLDVAPGEFFGLLGPNGAGKTTLIKILTTLLLPSEGTARIFGFDVSRDEKKIRRIMNMVAGGEQSGYGILTVREQLWMFSQFYGLPRKEGWRRVDELHRRRRDGRRARAAGQHPVHRAAPEDEHRARAAQRPMDPVPRRADARPRRRRRPPGPRAGRGLEAGGPRPDGHC